MKLEYPYAEKLKEMQRRLDEINREIEQTLVDNGRKQLSEADNEEGRRLLKRNTLLLMMAWQNEP